MGDYKRRGWWGLAAPADTPRSIIDKLNTAFRAVINDPKTRAFLDKQATIAAPTTPEEFVAFVRQDRLAAESLIKLANTRREDFKPEP